MKIIEKIAKTEDEAINLVLDEIGSNNKNLIKNVEVIGDSKFKFLSLGSKKVKVRVTLYDGPENEIIDLIKNLLLHMSIKVNNINILEYEEAAIKINLTTDLDSLLIGKRGKTLESIQYLLNIIYNKRKEPRIKIILDVEGYREKRIQSLQKLARNLALKVRQTRRERILEPMNPFERKIIHSELHDQEDISTESIGDGIFKKIKISLKN